MLAGIPLRASNEQWDAQRNAQAAAQQSATAAVSAERFLSRLGKQCWSEFLEARDYRREITEKMLEDLRALRVEYEPADIAMIRKQGGSEIYLPLIKNKVRLAVSLLYTIYNGPDRPYAGKPSPIVELPPDVQAAIMWQVEQQLAIGAQVMGPDPMAMQQMVDAMKDQVMREAKQWAERRAEYNTTLVDDEMTEGGFYKCLKKFFHGMCGGRGGFIKGPVVRMRQDLDWGPDGKTPIVTKKARRAYYSPRDFDIFPGPGACSVNDGTLSERIGMTKAGFYSLIGSPGFREDVIRSVLADFDAGMPLQGWYWEDAERTRLESQSDRGVFKSRKGMIDVIEHWTHVDGRLLAEWGVPPETVPDPDKPYSVCIWMCGPERVIGVQMNDDPMQERPYHKAGFAEVPGSFWYDGIPELGKAEARLCNAAARELSNNMGQAAGFFTEMQADRLARGQEVRRPMPYDVIQTAQARNGSSGPAIYVHQAQLHSEHYMRVMGVFSSQLDEVLGLPSFLSGMNQTQGAGGTSSGLAQQRQMQSDQFSYATTQVDECINGVAMATHRDMMMTSGGAGSGAENGDPNSPYQVTGDLWFQAKGARSLAQQQAVQVRINELTVALNNPVDLSITGIAGRAELLREAVKGIPGIDAERVVPPRDQILIEERARMMQPQQPQEGGPASGQSPPKGQSTDPAGAPMGAGNNMVAV